MKKIHLSQKELMDILEYNRDTGIFKWKVTTSNRVNVGDVAGYVDRYVIISIDRHRYVAHRLAWLYEYGYDPDCEIDHIDQNNLNNRISNLRAVSSKENAKNKPMRKDNSSGITGVSFDRFGGKWVVRIKDNHGKYKNKGRFDSIDDAKRARDKALAEYGYSKGHGESYSQVKRR